MTPLFPGVGHWPYFLENPSDIVLTRTLYFSARRKHVRRIELASYIYKSTLISSDLYMELNHIVGGWGALLEQDHV